MTYFHRSLIAITMTALLSACDTDDNNIIAPPADVPLTLLPSESLPITINDATITGLTESIIISDLQGGEQLTSVEVFKGIRFSNAARFEHSNLTTISDDIDATQFGDVCPQLKITTQAQSEDCLNINIWRPEGTQSGDNLPVYVVIHGGDFEHGAGSDPLIHGDTVVAQGALDNKPFIAVSFNYRLGLLGSYWQKGANIDGNYGLGDQQQALNWVNQHITEFGGNTTNITLLGQGAGAMSSGLLQQSIANGTLDDTLFQRNIMHSNAYGFEYRSYAVAKQQVKGLDLQDESLETVLAAQADILNPVTRIANWVLRSSLPVINDLSPIPLGQADNTPMATLLPFSPYLLCEKTSFTGSCSKNAAQPVESDFVVPTVIGSNAQEANTIAMLPSLTFLIPKILELVNQSQPELAYQLDDEALFTAMHEWLQLDANKAILTQQLTHFMSLDEVAAQLALEDILAALPKSAYEAIAKLYFGLANVEATNELLTLADYAPLDERNLSHAFANISRFKMMLNDLLFTGPARLKAIQADRSGTQVSFYHFAVKPSFNVWTYHANNEEISTYFADFFNTIGCISGACNSSELPFVFNKAMKLDGSKVHPTKKEKALMNKLSRIWFSDALFEQYQYSENMDNVMVINQQGEILLQPNWDRSYQQGNDPLLYNGRLNGLEDTELLLNYLTK